MAYLGLVSGQLLVCTQAAGWWRGGTLNINIANTHGDIPSSSLVGDFQGVSNIEAGNRTFFLELWYRQLMGRVSLTLGIMDMNAHFAVNEFGAIFINSSFGLFSTFSDEMNVSVFPNTGLGAALHYSVGKRHAVRLGFFDGDPDFISLNPIGIKSPFEGNDGMMAVGEYVYSRGLLCEAGSYRVGGYYHSHTYLLDAPKDDPSARYGFYLIANERLGVLFNRSIDGFLQLSYSPRRGAGNNLYIGSGVLVRGVARTDRADELGLAVAFARFIGKHYSNERIYELSYQYPLGAHLYLQPDVQLIVHPSRFNCSVHNALVSILRFGVRL